MKLIEILSEGSGTGFAHLATGNFQNRKGDQYPNSGIPDVIDVQGDEASFEFKNTSEKQAQQWVEQYLKSKNVKYSSIQTSQDGDYHDDWVSVRILE